MNGPNDAATGRPDERHDGKLLDDICAQPMAATPDPAFATAAAAAALYLTPQKFCKTFQPVHQKKQQAMHDFATGVGHASMCCG